MHVCIYVAYLYLPGHPCMHMNAYKTLQLQWVEAEQLLVLGVRSIGRDLAPKADFEGLVLGRKLLEPLVLRCTC